MMRREKGIVAVLILVVVLLWGYFSNPGLQRLRLRATGLNSHFNAGDFTSFTQYVEASRIMIKKARIKARVNSTDEVVAENAPAELLPDPEQCKVNSTGKYNKGILLIHGLLDSGYSMQQLGKFFQQQCFVVEVVLLAGHGTAPGDLLHSTYQDWTAVTAFGAAELAKKVDQVYLGGFSLGGLLAINEALQNPAHYKAIILFAPVLKINSSLTPLIAPVYWLSHVIYHLQWWSVYADSALTRYESLPINAVYQTAALAKKVRGELVHKTLRIPLIIEQSKQDETVDAEATLRFFKANPNPYSRMLWFYENKTYPQLTDVRIQAIRSTLPDSRILSMSHLSLILPENDPIFGINGVYKDCLHYKAHSPQWQQCKGGMDSYFAEITPANLKAHLIQRITFNPFYDFFTNVVRRFLADQP